MKQRAASSARQAPAPDVCQLVTDRITALLSAGVALWRKEEVWSAWSDRLTRTQRRLPMMAYARVAALFLSLAASPASAGCEDQTEKKARRAERKQKARREEMFRRRLQFDPGNYTPAPIDMSMERKPAATLPPGVIPTPPPTAAP